MPRSSGRISASADRIERGLRGGGCATEPLIRSQQDHVTQVSAREEPRSQVDRVESAQRPEWRYLRRQVADGRSQLPDPRS
jgi:hypothetical protein